MAVGVLALVLATDVVRTQACSSPNPQPSPAPTPTPTPAPAAEVFTTADGVRFSVDIMATNLQIPWSLAFAPDGRLFVTERPGRVRILDLGAGTNATALTLDDSLHDGEAGTLGLALDPSFSSNRLVYLYYTAQMSGGSVNRVVRYREVGGQLGERAVLLDNIPAAGIHDGGRIRFGPDGLPRAYRLLQWRSRLPQNIKGTPSSRSPQRNDIFCEPCVLCVLR